MTPEEAKGWLQTTDSYVFDQETVIDALSTIAGLRFMYGVAVEMPHETGYLAEDIEGEFWAHSDPHFPAVMWFEWDKDAEDIAYFWNRDYPEHATARVVRRLVGEPEVKA